MAAIKHGDGYTEHMKVVCQKCGATLMQCGNCGIEEPRVVKPRLCVELLVGATECIGKQGGLQWQA